MRYFLLFLFAWTALRWLFRLRPSPVARPEAPPGWHPGEIHDMARDPICGAFVATPGALTTVAGGRTIHFCSAGCYRRFLAAPEPQSAPPS